METGDITAVCQLLSVAFPRSREPADWQRTVEWLYFSTPTHPGIPRAFVLTNDDVVIGHIGVTVSEFEDDKRRLQVVQTVNWALSQHVNVGFWAVRLMMHANSLGDLAIVVGGSDTTHALISKVGFRQQPSVGRYLKVLRPVAFVSGARAYGQGWGALLGKLALCSSGAVTSSARKRLGRTSVAAQVEVRTLEPRELTGLPVLRPAVETSEDRAGPVRNTLSPEFLAWYASCPEGDVRIVRFQEGGDDVGMGAVLLQQAGRSTYATILTIDSPSGDTHRWVAMLSALENWLAMCSVSHVNAIGSYAPWCQALELHGYRRLREMSVWMLDREGVGVRQAPWHLTAIEADLGYLFP